MSECKACNAEVIWLRAENTQKRAPINAAPEPNGNIMVSRVSDTYKVLTKADMAEMEGSLFERATRNDRHTSHFATCPKAGEFRKKATDS